MPGERAPHAQRRAGAIANGRAGRRRVGYGSCMTAEERVMRNYEACDWLTLLVMPAFSIVATLFCIGVDVETLMRISINVLGGVVLLSIIASDQMREVFGLSRYPLVSGLLGLPAGKPVSRRARLVVTVMVGLVAVTGVAAVICSILEVSVAPALSVAFVWVATLLTCRATWTSLCRAVARREALLAD